MQTLAHIQYGWMIANADKEFNIIERRLITLAALVPDIDSIAQLFGQKAFYDYHHIVLHNITTLIIISLLSIIFTRRIKVLLLISFSYILHLMTDYLTSDWPMQLFYPFSKWEITLEEFIPSEMILFRIQPVIAYGIIAATVYIFIKYKRTFIEAFSKTIDTILVNFITLPLTGKKCGYCGKKAFYECSDCGKNLCANHRKFNKNLSVSCKNKENCSAKN